MKQFLNFLSSNAVKPNNCTKAKWENNTESSALPQVKNRVAYEPKEQDWADFGAWLDEKNDDCYLEFEAWSADFEQTQKNK